MFALDQTPCIVCKKTITRITLDRSRNTINLVALGINNSFPQSSHDNNPRLMAYWRYCTIAPIQICFANINMFCNLYIYWQDHNSSLRLAFHAWAQWLGGCVLVFAVFAWCWVCYFRPPVQPINFASAWCQGYFFWPGVWSIACLAARISCFLMSRIFQFLRLYKTTRQSYAQFASNTFQKALQNNRLVTK